MDPVRFYANQQMLCNYDRFIASQIKFRQNLGSIKDFETVLQRISENANELDRQQGWTSAEGINTDDEMIKMRACDYLQIKETNSRIIYSIINIAMQNKITNNNQANLTLPNNDQTLLHEKVKDFCSKCDESLLSLIEDRQDYKKLKNFETVKKLNDDLWALYTQSGVIADSGLRIMIEARKTDLKQITNTNKRIAEIMLEITNKTTGTSSSSSKPEKKSEPPLDPRYSDDKSKVDPLKNQSGQDAFRVQQQEQERGIEQQQMQYQYQKHKRQQRQQRQYS